jgi:hypothetical protein
LLDQVVVVQSIILHLTNMVDKVAEQQVVMVHHSNKHLELIIQVVVVLALLVVGVHKPTVVLAVRTSHLVYHHHLPVEPEMVENC